MGYPGQRKEGVSRFSWSSTNHQEPSEPYTNSNTGIDPKDHSIYPAMIRARPHTALQPLMPCAMGVFPRRHKAGPHRPGCASAPPNLCLGIITDDKSSRTAELELELSFSRRISLLLVCSVPGARYRSAPLAALVQRSNWTAFAPRPSYLVTVVSHGACVHSTAVHTDVCHIFGDERGQRHVSPQQAQQDSDGARAHPCSALQVFASQLAKSHRLLTDRCRTAHRHGHVPS